MSTAHAVLASMRPRQWTKNLLVFAPLVFAHELAASGPLLSTLVTFVAFCLLSGAAYLLNDVLDLERDRVHAKKCTRPIATGELPVRTALAAALVGGILGIGMTLAIGPLVALVAAGYVALQIVYSLWLKHEVLLDAFAIAAGFVLRTAAGAIVVGAALSPWLYSAVSLLSLFLAFGKRRHELLLLDEEAYAHRPALHGYSAPLLDVLLSSVTAATIVTYAMYSFASETGQAAPNLIFTVPFVVFGLFRYLFLIYGRNLGGNPEEIILTDAPIIGAVVLWLVVAIAALYL